MSHCEGNIEGNLRGVMASLTPEQLNEDKVTFARHCSMKQRTIYRPGLVLDTPDTEYFG